jgi:hypothetical protein
LYTPNIAVFADGPEKPGCIWSRVGQRPLLAAGNSNGDLEMLEYAKGTTHPPFRLLVLHDDAKREFAYAAGAERALEIARAKAWTVVSMEKDWARVFPELKAA